MEGDSATMIEMVERFEDAWESGHRPAIEAFLPAEGSSRRWVLFHLVQVDLERRLKVGEPARVEDYLSRYPDLASPPETVLELLRAEWEQRRRREGDLRLEEYLERFPHLVKELRRDLVRLAGADVTPQTGSTPAPALPSQEANPYLPNSPLGASPVIAGYEILGELGRGGMGVVYKARHAALNRVVAVKMLRDASLASPQDLERFRKEVQAVARLQHPNIVQIHEVGEAMGHPYFALEFVAGGSLAQKLAGKPQPALEACRLVEILARAIHAAHQAGIVHRDLKPANILLASGGCEPPGNVPGGSHPPLAEFVPKITDFGLSKRLDASTAQTRSGAIVGTPGYMAPEQAVGKAGEIGPATDVYALGPSSTRCSPAGPRFWPKQRWIR
jgi:serine/threonine-protein kinase